MLMSMIVVVSYLYNLVISNNEGEQNDNTRQIQS